MVKQNKFVKFARKSDVDAQSLYIEDDARLHLTEELKARGTRRILVICDPLIRTHTPYEEFIETFTEAGFRSFVYSRQRDILLDSDVEAGLQVYVEYNCDTIVAIGGTCEIDCGKLVAALVNNPVKTISAIAGVDKLSNDIPLLCTILTQNCASTTTACAEYYDNSTGKWQTVMSGYLIPHMVVIDTALSERISYESAVSSALNALCITLEAYVSPVAKLFPEYRASAVIASTIFFRNLEKYCNNTTDSFLRKQIAVGGFYAGLSARKTGIGYAHIIMHVLLSRYNITHGSGMTKILMAVLREQLSDSEICEALAGLARSSHFCSQSLPNDKAAESLIDNLERLCQKVASGLEEPVIPSGDIEAIIYDIEKEAKIFNLGRELGTEALVRIVATLT